MNVGSPGRQDDQPPARRHDREWPTVGALHLREERRGKSQMAAGLMRKAAGDTVAVGSAGTKPGATINELSADVLIEVGVDITDQAPKQLTDKLIRGFDRVIVLGREAQVRPVDDTLVECWDTDEPSERGIDGIESMRLVRDDITRRVEDLADQLGQGRGATS